jgi:hypothetical protein
MVARLSPFLLLSILWVPLSAHTIYVHPDSSVSSIQAGLNLAGAGDTVLVGPGTYTENLVWPAVESIKLFGELGAESTIVDAGGSGNALCMEDGGFDKTTVVAGLTFQNAVGTFWGGGIYLNGTSPVIRDCIVRDNVGANDGGGILSHNFGEPTLQSNVITGNYAYEGGGIAGTAANPSIFYNLIYGNEAVNGGGISLFKTDNVVRNNEIFDNVSTYGAGIYCYQTVAEIKRNEIHGNHAGERGGGVFVSAAEVLVTDNGIYSNVSDSLGGGVYVDFAWCTFNSNSIVDNGNGGMYSTYSDDSTDAESNWWGDSTGPYHPTLNPSGAGDTVSDFIDFVPWLDGPALCGDADGNGGVTPADGFLILNYFGAGPEPASCFAANTDGLNGLTPGDGYRLLNFLGGGLGLDCEPCELERRVLGSGF